MGHYVDCISFHGEFIEATIEGSNTSGQWQQFDLLPNQTLIGVYGVMDDLPIIRGLGLIVLSKS
jgi:hypothetical protein